MTSRKAWLAHAHKMARPVLEAQARGRLLAEMPRWAGEGNRADRVACGPLEAFTRLALGLVPWMVSEFSVEPEEASLRAELLGLSRKGLEIGLDSAHEDAWELRQGHQRLVDVAFLAQSVVRCPGWARGHEAGLRVAFDAVREIRPSGSNWVLFSAMVEAGMHEVGGDPDLGRVRSALADFEKWYVGDGHYGDGPHHRWDHYNSFVIQPMLDDLVARYPGFSAELAEHQAARSARFGAVQERMIAPDGSFLSIGRSMAYRTGVFHHLASLALRERLPVGLTAGQVRTGLMRALDRSLGAPGTYDEAGWLLPGLAGHQPSLAESYICIGSLYLASAIFLPLGLAPESGFWTEPDQPGTWERTWSGADVPRDQAMKP